MNLEDPSVVLLLNAVDVPLAVVVRDQDLVFTNGAFRKLVGASKAGSVTLDKYWPGFQWQSPFPGQISTRFETAEGEKLPVTLKLTEIDGDHLLISVASEPSPASTAAGFHIQRIQTLGVLAGGIAHDFNNILAGILGHISYLKTVLPASGNHVESLTAIDEGARRASSMTQQILNFSKLEIEEKLERVDLGALVTGTCKLLRRAISPKYKLECQVSEDSVVILGVEGRLAQVIANLVINARDAVSSDGEITVRVAPAPTSEKIQRLFGDSHLKISQWALLQVEDNGVGMPAEVISRAFEPYYSTKKEKGTGLGLATVREIVHGLGGVIDIESKVGKGTTVSIYLPAASAAPSGRGKDHASRKPELLGGTERILIVDDESPVRNVLAMSLEHLGYEVEVASSGMEAIDKYESEQSDFDLVILDMLMPKLPGDEVFKVLKKTDPDVRVLVISGYSSEEAVQRILDGGGKGFIQKPFTIEELARKVRECLE